jgi:hypothetical protein
MYTTPFTTAGLVREKVPAVKPWSESWCDQIFLPLLALTA